MDNPVLVDTLDELTGSWVPGGEATAGDLAEARLLLAGALSSGLAPQDISPGPVFQARPATVDRPAIEAAAHQAPAGAALTAIPYVVSTNNFDPSAFAMAAGMKIDKTLGPFVDAFGAEHWVALIPIPRKIPISSATRGLLGYLIVDNPGATLGAGSLWVAAAAFNLLPPLNGAVGLSFSSGTVKTSGSVTVSNTGVVIGAGGELKLTLTLAPPAAPTGLPGLGLDFTHMVLCLPDSVTLVLTEAGAEFTAIADSSATVYGTSFTLKRNLKKPHAVRIFFNCLLFPCDASISSFSFQKVLSTDVVPSGQGVVTEAGWALVLFPALSPQLGAADSAGSLVLEIGGGAGLEFGGLTTPTQIASLNMALEPRSIQMAAVNGPRDVLDRITLWTPAQPAAGLLPAPAQHSSEIDLTVPRGSSLFMLVSSQMEAAIASGKARVNADRPLAADGSRLPVAFTSVQIGFIHTTTRSVAASMSVPDFPPNNPPQNVIALENALLTMGPALTGALQAVYSGASLAGTLELTFQNVRILPILPDPYASAFAAQLPLPGTLSALDTWTQQPGATLAFKYTPNQGTSASAPSLDRIAPAAVSQSALTLLDLSSNADQFGVSFIFSEYFPFAVNMDGMAVAVPQELMQVYALPGISWEPVVDDATNDWLNAPSNDDGPPTTLQASTVNLVRMEPNVALPAFAQAAADADTNAAFTLPFGLMANLQMNANTPAGERPSYSFIKADYASGLSAARQLVIQALATIKVGDPALPGSTTTGSQLPVPLNSQVYGVLTLGNDPLGAAQFFDQQFSANQTYAEIPVERIDLSGYGTSMFSDWQIKDLSFVGVVRSRFEVLVGRTSYELVQIASVIIPWSIRITRTIIFDRFSTGLVVRHDTGWKAVGFGKFELLQADQQLPGAVDHLQNIHNITVGSGSSITLSPPDISRNLEFRPVTFDADVVMNSAVTAQANGSTTSVVAATQVQGYVQLTVGPVATAFEILKAMQQLPGGVSGVMGCILNVGPAPSAAAPKFTLNISSLTAKVTGVNVAGQNYPAVAVALNGTPALPRDGAWSIARRGKSDATPSPVDPTFPVPLIFGSNNDANPAQWRLLGPEDALSSFAPNTAYGLLQGTGTSSSLFENPVIDALGGALSLDPSKGVPVPKLADLGSLLGSSGIFPNLANVLQIPTSASDALSLAQDGFQKTFEWDITKPDHLLPGRREAARYRDHQPEPGISRARQQQPRPRHTRLPGDQRQSAGRLAALVALARSPEPGCLCQRVWQ